MSGISSRFINHTSPDIFRKSFNAQTATTQNLLRQLMKSEFSTDTLGGTVFYAAIIISIEKLEKINNDSSFFGFLKSTGVTESRSYKVLIPELHAGLPSTDLLPEFASLEDKKTPSDERKALKEKYVKCKENNKSYATVVEFNPDNPANVSLKVGDSVWVIFQNSRTVENGFLFSKIIGNGVIGAESFTKPTLQDVQNAKSKTPFTPPSDVEKEKNRNPPGFDGRYIVPYDIVVEMMASSKGAPYRYHNFPRMHNPEVLANDDEVDGIKRGRAFLSGKGIKTPFTKEEYEDAVSKRPLAIGELKASPWENNLIGIQCNGFSMRALERMGIIGGFDRVITTPIPGAEALGVGTIREIFKRANTRGMLHLIGYKVPVGEQLPGDYVLNGGDAAANCSHMTICVTYPDKSKNNHSVIWGANCFFGDGYIGYFCDSDQWMSGVGTNPKNAFKEKSIANDILFKPLYASELKQPCQYYRIRDELLAPSFQKFKQNGTWKPQSGKTLSSFYNKDMAKNSYAQYNYEPPQKISEHPPAVVGAPDLFKTQRIFLMEKEGISPNIS